jgi:alpha-L-arabinofuranosidase
MRIKTGLFLFAVLLTFTADVVADPDPDFYIFLCFGQSNMEGPPGIEEQDKAAVDRRFQVLTAVDFPVLGRTKGQWYPAVPPLCRPGTGISPADYFGRTLVANLPDSVRVGVVNVSVAGCKIELFEKETFRTCADTAQSWMKNIIKQYDGNPYQTLVELAKLAQRDGVIKGILLHQGESNTNDKEWPLKVKGIYDNLVRDLNLKAEDVPLLAGELVNADQGGACASQNAVIAELPKTLPNSYIVSSSGCASRPDHLHFTPAGYRLLGTRFAETMLSRIGRPSAGSVDLTVHTDQPVKTISDGIYGQFLEHIFNSVHGGLWGDQILNGALESRPPRPNWMKHQNEDEKAPVPLYWEFVGDTSDVRLDRDNPFNAEVSVRIAPQDSGHLTTETGIRQRNIALARGERYTLSLYARGGDNVVVQFEDGDTPIFTNTFTGLTAEWQQFSVEFVAPRAVKTASLTIGSTLSGPVNIDQVSLFSASALATGGYRPDLLKAVTDLRPASIRWPGGGFANWYNWRHGIGPREKRIPHPLEQWGDRDTYQFGTDEFIQLCEKIGTEPILVLNTSRGVEDALDWLEYCMGDTTTEYGKMRAANGHAAPYSLKTIEIDNEPWLMMEYSKYLGIVKKFCPPLRARYPKLQLSVAGGYGYDLGPGEGNQEANRNWDPRIVANAGKLFNILSPHYYNGIFVAPDYVDDPYRYEQFLKGRGEIIRKSANPNMKIYVSEWNLTEKTWGNDWRVGLYAGGILNAFERQSDAVVMSCPALFMRRQGVTTEWDNALINFDPVSWFPGATYVAMKLWRDAYAPHLLAVDGPERPFNFTAARSADQQTVFLKVVNPTQTRLEAVVHFKGDLPPKTATMQLIAPGGETVKNSIECPDNIKAVTSAANVENGTVRFAMPPLSAAVVRVKP